MIKITKLCKNYLAGDTVVKALDELSTEVEKGDFLAIAGPSGSGKTTLLNILGCLDKADSGEMLIEGRLVSRLKKEEQALFRREYLGFIFQSYNLIPVLNAYENVAFSLHLLGLGDSEIRERSMLKLKEVGLENLENRRPSQLSGGQQQRVAIARALVKNPKIILADEPTANLDSKTGQEILDLMKALNVKQGSTFLFATHDPMVMNCADRLLEIHDGKIRKDQRKKR